MDQQVAVRQTYFQRMLFDRCLDDDFVRRFWGTPDLIVDQGLPLKLSDASTVTRISLCDMSGSATDGGEVHAIHAVAKRFNPRGLVHSIRHLLMASRASRNWTYGRMLVAAGVATPRPFAMLEKRWGLCRLHSYVVMEHVEGIPLDVFLNQERLPAGALARISSQVADLWWKLDELRITHGDLKPANLIVTPDERLFVIDLDGVSSHRFSSQYRSRRKREWWRLMRAWQHRPEVEEAIRSAIVQRARTAKVGLRSNNDPAICDRKSAA